MNNTDKIYVAGNTGLVGSSLVRNLEKNGYDNLSFSPYPEYDLRYQQVVNTFFERNRPDYVFLAAAKVGGIHANNTYPAEFIYDNLMIEANIINAAYKFETKKLLFLGSSCIYPKHCPQPIKEEFLLTGELEPTNEPYAIAKIAGIKLCQYYRKQYGCDFISAMPTNLYGPGDNYHLENSHVLPAMIRKMHLAKKLEEKDYSSIIKNILVHEKVNITAVNDINTFLLKHGIKVSESSVDLNLWGTGSPRREFLYVDDLSEALIHLMQQYSDDAHINVGVGSDQSIKEIADSVKGIIGFTGNIQWDIDKPDGTPQKLLDVSKLEASGWKSRTSLIDGIRQTYTQYLEGITL